MDLVTTILAVIGVILICTEIGAGVILFLNRDRIFPILRANLGLSQDSVANASRHATLTMLLERLDRKINYIGRHVKFEREVLREAGILRDREAKSPDDSVNVARPRLATLPPLRRG
jgi:hypothetical protein